MRSHYLTGSVAVILVEFYGLTRTALTTNQKSADTERRRCHTKRALPLSERIVCFKVLHCKLIFAFAFFLLSGGPCSKTVLKAS